MVIGLGDQRLDTLRLAGQEPVHAQAQVVPRVPGQGAPRSLPQPRHLDGHQRELSRFEPVMAAEQDSVPDRHPDGLVRGPDAYHRDARPGQPSAHRLQAAQCDRRLAHAPEPLVEGREGGRAGRVLAQPYAVRRHLKLGVSLLDRAAAQHVHADPLDVVALEPGPQQRRVQCSAVEADVGGRHRDHAGPACVLERHGAGEQAHIDGRAEPGDLFRRFAFPPVRGGDQPSRQRAADEPVRILARPGRRSSGACRSRGGALFREGLGRLQPGGSRYFGTHQPGRLALGWRRRLAGRWVRRRHGAESLVPRSRTRQHDALHQVVGSYDADNELAGQVPPRGHRPFPP